MLDMLANLTLRRKVLIALAPMFLMAIIGRLYASNESARIDKWYSQLIDNEIKAVHHVDLARALSMRYSQYLYQLIVETDPNRMHVLDGELDNSYSEFQANIADAAR